jgi:uncharacterized protein involved in response to NO
VTTTRGEQMLALRKKRMAEAHAFLRGGFRPFFFGGTAWALIALILWLMSVAGAVTLPTAFGAAAWHRHEMLFGFVGAVIAGFLLTAIPNWTGRLPIAGKPLLALFGLWLAGRAAMLFSEWLGPAQAAAIDVGFYLVLVVVAAREVVAAGSRRNMPVVGMVFLVGLANAVDHAAVNGLIDTPDIGWRAAIAIIVLLISLIGGRVTPSFTRNWLAKRGVSDRLPTQAQSFDLLAIVSTAFALVLWLAFPDHRSTGLALILASLFQALRLSRWRGWSARSDALVLILHVGYAWVPAGLLLLGFSVAGFALPRSAAIHALTAGAMATMILAVMTRATLGHTARELQASKGTIAIYSLVTIGAVLRVAASLGAGDYQALLHVSGISWAAAMAGFLIVYGPILWRPRLGDAP